MKLFLIRHGQTDWNFEQRFQGQSDIPLNAVGHRQASDLAERFASESFDVVYSSDLQRALETAHIVTGLSTDIKIEPRLREISFGDWEGLTYDEIKEKHPAVLAEWENDVYQKAPPNGETVGQLVQRVQSVLISLQAEHANQTVLIVGHGGVLQSLICLALNLPPDRYWQFHLSPASLSQVAFYPAGAIVNLLNDTSHLRRNP